MNKKLKKDLDDMTVRYNALKDSSSKEAESLQHRIAKTEQAIGLLQKEKSDVQSELKSYRVKLAETIAREETTRQSFEKAKKAYDAASEKSQKSSALQRKVEELERVHSQSKRARTEEIERLQAKLQCEQDAQKEIQHKLQETIRNLESRIADSTRDKDNLTNALEQAQRQHAQLQHEQQLQRAQIQSKLQTLEEAAAQERERMTLHAKDLQAKLQSNEVTTQNMRQTMVLQQEQTEKSMQNLKATLASERQQHQETLEELESTREQITSVMADADQVYTRLHTLEEHWKTLTTAHAQLLKSVRSSEVHRECIERAEDLETQLEESEDRFIEHMRANARVEAEVVQLREEMHMLEALLKHEDERPRIEADVEENAWKELEEDLRALGPADHHSLEIALHEYDAILVRDAYSALSTEYEQKCNQIEEAQNDLEQMERDHLKTQRELATAQMTIDTLEQEVALLDKQLEEFSNAPIQELEEEISQLQAALQEKIEAQKDDSATIRKLQVSNAQEKVMQDKLLVKVQEMQEHLDNAEQYQESYEQLQEHVDVLVKEYGLAEEEQRRLGLFNAALLGNANPKQRIKHVANLREQNAKLKKDLLTTAHERDKARMELQNAQRELESYKAIATAQPTRISRVQRHVLNARDDNIHTIDVGKLMAKGMRNAVDDIENENDVSW